MAILIGLDVGTYAVKVAVIRTAYRRLMLTHVGMTPIAEHATVEDAIVQTVRTAVGEKGGTGEGIAAAIDGSRAAIRRLTLPSSVQKQLVDVLPFELESVVPFDVTESVFDFRALPAPKNASEVEVVSVVARVEDVKSRIDLVRNALGAEPDRIGVGAYALAGLVPYLTSIGPEEVVLLVDLGRRSTEVLILKGGEPLFARTLSFGTEGIAQTAPRLARELRTSIASHRANGGELPVRAYLAGGGSFESGAEHFLAAELDLPVEHLPPPSLEIAGVLPELMPQLPWFAKAIGLALSLQGRAFFFDLRKGPLAYERGFAWIREKIPVLAGMGVVILMSFLFSAWAQLYATGKQQATLEAALATVSKEVLGEETTSASRAQELLTQQAGGNDEDPMPALDGFDVMVKLSQVIPPTMTHDIEELDVQKGHAVIHGIVGTIPEAQEIATALRAEKCLQDVKITRTNQDVRSQRQKYVLEFELKCQDDKAKKKEGSAAGAGSATTAGGK